MIFDSLCPTPGYLCRSTLLLLCPSFPSLLSLPVQSFRFPHIGVINYHEQFDNGEYDLPLHFTSRFTFYIISALTDIQSPVYLHLPISFPIYSNPALLHTWWTRYRSTMYVTISDSPLALVAVAGWEILPLTLFFGRGHPYDQDGHLVDVRFGSLSSFYPSSHNFAIVVTDRKGFYKKIHHDFSHLRVHVTTRNLLRIIYTYLHN